MTVVVKLGTTLVVDRGRVRRSLLRARARELAALVRGGEHACVVSSGAVGLGLERLGLETRPRAVPRLQAASALGQSRLQAAWDEALGREGLLAAQVLLTASDLQERASYVNVGNALLTLFRAGAVPVVNENDATATDELTFGDNDALAAQVAVLVRARLLVLLTEVEGVYSRAPGTPGATLLEEGDTARGAAFAAGSGLGRGGMRSKVVAAEMAAAAGIPTVIASGRGESVLAPIVAGERRGTRFAPGGRSESAFKLWLRYGKPASGRVVVDAGARRAMVEQGASLLAVGVVSCEGRFGPGDGIEVVGPDGEAFAKGIAGAGADELASRPRDLEVVHRDRLVVY